MTSEPIRILYIDDDPGFARLVQKTLGRKGYEVVVAATSEDAAAKLADAGFDAIGLDHNLEGETGLDVLARLRAGEEPPPPVVYVTASADTAVAVAALKAGAFDYVPKAVDKDFIELLDSAFSGAIEKGNLKRERARAMRELREAKERAETLLGEVNHRVANSLGLVASLVRLQSGTVSDPAARAALDETQGRISAIAGIHRRLYTSHDVRFVEIDEYLGSLVRELETAMKAAGHGSRILLDAGPIRVPTDKAVSLAVIVTELVTNAFKYAYRDRQAGEVRISLAMADETTASLCVEDDGIGWTGQGPIQGTGVGSRIVKAMAANLGTVVRYDDTAHTRGTRVLVDFRLAS